MKRGSERLLERDEDERPMLGAEQGNVSELRAGTTHGYLGTLYRGEVM